MTANAEALARPQRGRSLPAWTVAAALALAWLLAGPRTPDLAAQVYRAALFARHGFTLWDNGWYGGHYVPGYSLLYPPVAAVLGPRLVGVLAAVASAALFDHLARRHFHTGTRPGTILFAVAATADVAVGRLTFALGVAIGLAAVAACVHERPRAATALAVLCAAASPVAALFLVLASAAHGAAHRSRRTLGMAMGALVATVLLQLAFPDGGTQPFATHEAIALLVVAAAVAVLAPRRERALRIGALLYGLAGLVAFLSSTPMGSNVERLGALFAVPLLLCARRARGERGRAGRVAMVALVVAVGFWQWSAALGQALNDAGDPSVSAEYYAPLAAFLDGVHGPPGRLEVPFTRSHWETVYLADHALLARGWERQLDTRYDGLFYGRPLTSRSYAAWLRDDGVRYVALPDAPLDSSARQEAAIIDSRPRYLVPVWRSAHWQVFRVRHPGRLVSGPATLRRLDVSGFTVWARRPGRILVRVRFTPYWSVTGGVATIAPAGDGWTRLTVLRPGPVAVSARLSADALLDAAG